MFNENSQHKYKQCQEIYKALTHTMAHELLQPLTVIMAELDLAQMSNRPVNDQLLYDALYEAIARIRFYETLDDFELEENKTATNPLRLHLRLLKPERL